MTHGSLFSGIGGFDLAARWMGWTNAFHVERDPFCRKVLAHHFPESQAFDDVKTFDATPFRGRLSVLSGGFPCQPFSAAGKRAGTSDDRYLWPEMFRIIREARPTYVVAENVRGLLSWNDGMVLDTVCADLEGEGYEVLPVVLGAASVNAPHRRDRIWIVARNTDGGAKSRDRKEQTISRQQNTKSVGICSPINANDQRGAGRSGEIQGADGEIPQRHNDAEPRYASAADATNAQYDGSYRAGRNATQPSRNQQKNGVFVGDGADATNATSELLKRNEPAKRRATGQKAVQQENRPTDSEQSGTVGQDGNATNANGAGKRQDNGQGESRQHDQASAGSYWQDFPTVAPVCGGDDGLPERLDGITFPKWRRESIKAYGNAIVPQLAFQIFKALQNV